MKVSDTIKNGYKRVTLEGYRDEEHLEGYDCVVVHITEPYARRLLALIALVQGLKALDQEIYQLRVWDLHAFWFNRDWGRLDDDVEPIQGDESLQTEADLIHVSDTAVRWTCVAKYSDVRCESAEVEKSDLQAIIDEFDQHRRIEQQRLNVRRRGHPAAAPTPEDRV